MMPTVPSPPAVSRSTTTTLAPSRAKPSAVARPMPFPAPVISATLPLKSIVSSAALGRSTVSLRAERSNPRIEELPPCLLETDPHIGSQRTPHFDVERIVVGAPEHDLGLAEQGARAHANGKCRG